MKKVKLWLVVLLSLAGIALGIVLLFGSRHESSSVASLALSTSNATNPIPEQPSEQTPKQKNVWARPQHAKADNPVDRERMLQNENIRMDIALQAHESVWKTMALREDEKSRLRQSFVEYRTGSLRMIERPSEFAGVAQDDTNPTLPWNVYERRLKEILGIERYKEFEQSYRKEQFMLVKMRQAVRKAAMVKAYSEKTKE
jgi:hypothetical protein